MPQDPPAVPPLTPQPAAPPHPLAAQARFGSAVGTSLALAVSGVWLLSLWVAPDNLGRADRELVRPVAIVLGAGLTLAGAARLILTIASAAREHSIRRQGWGWQVIVTISAAAIAAFAKLFIVLVFAYLAVRIPMIAIHTAGSFL